MAERIQHGIGADAYQRRLPDYTKDIRNPAEQTHRELISTRVKILAGDNFRLFQDQVNQIVIEEPNRIAGYGIALAGAIVFAAVTQDRRIQTVMAGIAGFSLTKMADHISAYIKFSDAQEKIQHRSFITSRTLKS